VSRFGFVDREKAHYLVNLLCTLLCVSRSGYYAWAARGPSARKLPMRCWPNRSAPSTSRRDTPMVRRGSSWICVMPVGRKRVARIMRERGWQGVHRRSWWNEPSSYGSRK